MLSGDQPAELALAGDAVKLEPRCAPTDPNAG